VTQLGTRLHVLLKRDTPAAVKKVKEILRQAGFEAEVQQTPANLEDVFVASTSFEGDERVAPRA